MSRGLFMLGGVELGVFSAFLDELRGHGHTTMGITVYMGIASLLTLAVAVYLAGRERVPK